MAFLLARFGRLGRVVLFLATGSGGVNYFFSVGAVSSGRFLKR
jgi:hypothetical protein